MNTRNKKRGKQFLLLLIATSLIITFSANTSKATLDHAYPQPFTGIKQDTTNRQEANKVEEDDWQIFKDDMHQAMQESLRALEEINLEQVMEDIEIAISDLNRNIEEELKVNIDSVVREAQKSIREIDMEEIKQNIEEAIVEMELSLEDMEKQMESKKEKK